MDDEEEAGSSSILLKPLLRIHGAQVNKLHCNVCQETCDKKHKKRKKISEIKGKHTFKYVHPYRNVFSNDVWNSLYGCRSCKAMFLNENLRKAQQRKESDTSNNDESISNNAPETPDTTTEG